MVNGEPVADSSYIATSLSALRDSCRHAGEHYILTCWCGAAGCAGIQGGVQVKHSPDSVSWLITEPSRHHFTFARDAYVDSVEGAVRTALERLAELRSGGAPQAELVPAVDERLLE